jgi:hypothetical protein
MSEGLQKYRAWDFEEFYTDELGNLYKTTHMINLADISSYSAFIFPAPVVVNEQLTRIEMFNGHNYIARIPYSEFRRMHLEYLVETGDLDTRSLRKKKVDSKNTDFSITKIEDGILKYHHYLKPFDSIFHEQTGDCIRISFYEKNKNVECPHLGDGCIFLS